MDVLNDRGIILLTAHLKGKEVEGGEAAGRKLPAKRDQETSLCGEAVVLSNVL